jgi:hypothetical protein
MRLMSGQRFYEEGEAEDILRRALHQTDSGAIDRQRLLAMASELGISESAVLKAEAELATERGETLARQQEDGDRRAFHKHRTNRLVTDFSGYLFFNVFLIGFWWLTGHGYFWPGWMLGIGVAGLAGSLLHNHFGDTQKEFEKWRRERDKGKEPEREAL